MVRQLEWILFCAFDEFRIRRCRWLRRLVGIFLRNLVDGNTGSLVELLCGLLVGFILGLLVGFFLGLWVIRQRMCAGIRPSADLIRTNGSLSFLLV